MSGRLSWLGCGTMIGVALALPIGIYIGSGRPQQSNSGINTPPLSGRPQFPNLYSPKVLSDPYVIDQHRRIAQALERSCLEQGQHCNEAQLARRKIAQTEAE